MADLVRDGYTVARILSESAAGALRSYLLDRFCDSRTPGDDVCLYNIYARFPDLWPLLVSIGSVPEIRSRLGGRVIHLRHASAQFGKWSSWHRDTYGQHQAGFRLCERPDYAVLQTILVLQPFGLDLVSGSHLQVRAADPEPPADHVTPVVRPGDLIIFDTRLRHRGTPVVGEPDTGETRFYIPLRKVIVCGLFAGSDEFVAEYHAFSATLRQTTYRYLQDTPAYPDLLVRSAASYGIELP